MSYKCIACIHLIALLRFSSLILREAAYSYQHFRTRILNDLEWQSYDSSTCIGIFQMKFLMIISDRVFDITNRKENIWGPGWIFLQATHVPTRRHL